MKESADIMKGNTEIMEENKERTKKYEEICMNEKMMKRNNERQ
jgi:hypothetical protein